MPLFKFFHYDEITDGKEYRAPHPGAGVREASTRKAEVFGKNNGCEKSHYKFGNAAEYSKRAVAHTLQTLTKRHKNEKYIIETRLRKNVSEYSLINFFVCALKQYTPERHAQRNDRNVCHKRIYQTYKQRCAAAFFYAAEIVSPEILPRVYRRL